jgi:hypothetical protein
MEMWQTNSDVAENKYNELFNNSFDNIVDFVQLHYFTKRDDTEFWKSTKSIIEPTEFNRETLEVFKKCMPSWVYFTDSFTMFKQQNWIQVMAGLELFDNATINKLYYNNYTQQHISSVVEPALTKRKYERETDAFIEHDALLQQNKIYVN